MHHGIGYDARPRHVAVGDLNNDTHLDIVTANSGTDNIGVRLGYGNGTFADQITYSTGLGSRPYALALGDFNNDTQLDVVVANHDTNSIGLQFGDGNGRFNNPIITPLGSSRPLSLAAVDFNNDKQLDIVVVNYGTSSISILLGSRGGLFQIENTFYMGHDSIPYSLILAHFNGDKQLDIAVANYGTSMLTVLLSDKNKIFTNHKYTTGRDSHPCSIAVGDYNGDNIPDIAVANSGTSNIGVFLGYENGTFSPMMIQSTGHNSRPQFVVVNDFTNGTKLDIAVIDSENNNVIVLGGDGNGNFSIVVNHSTGYSSDPSSIATGDFDNDGLSDIAITNNATNNILVLTRYSTYLAAKQRLYSMEANFETSFVAVGDFNNDNRSDIVAVDGNSTAVIFSGLGDGNLIKSTQYSSEDLAVAMFVVNDVNKDNQLDLIISLYRIGRIVILLGRGDGSFIDGDTYSTGDGSFPQWIAVGDLNNDTHLDIVIANCGDDPGTNPSNLGVILGNENGSFGNVTVYLNGTHYYWTFIALSDFNNDTLLDIVAADSHFGYIAILLGKGNGSFDILSVEQIDDRPNTLAIGDLNHDRQLDIVYASAYLNNVGVVLGNGDGTFRNITRYYADHGSWPWSIILADLNDDTLLDIAVTQLQTSSIVIFVGFGNGSFALPQTFPVKSANSPKFMAFSDFNNDNQLDIVVGNSYSNKMAVLLFHYETDFTNETNYFSGSGPHPYSIAVGNFIKNNQSGIVVANWGNDNIEVLFDYNSGTFMNQTKYSTGFGSYPQFVAVADFNRDRHQDVVVAYNRYGTINVFFGDGNGAFDTASVHLIGSDSFPSSIAVGDFNKDSWTDIVVANSDTNDIAVFLGFNYATFTNQSILISGATSIPAGIAAGDFNNDHHQDIAVISFFRQMVYIYFGYGNGTFTEQTLLPTGIYRPATINVADINGDKQLDLVVTSGTEQNIGVFLGYGNGSFVSQITNPTSDLDETWAVAIGDCTDDNILDIVIADYNTNSINIFMGYGNGTFIHYITYSTGDNSSPAYVLVDDLNNDNISDIVVANFDSYNIGLFFGYGNGTYTDMTPLSARPNSAPYSVATGHLNNDTWIDIAVAHSEKSVGIFFGYGNGSFSSEKTYSTGFQSDLYAITIADLNNDTKLDIVIADFGHDNGNIGIFYGYGDGTFAVYKTYSTGYKSEPLAFVVYDFNNDTRLDLAIGYQTKDSVGIMLQYKTEPFATPSRFSTGNDSHPMSVATGDFNSDGKLDIAVANFGGKNVGILLGNGKGKFVTQKTYSSGENSRPISIAVGDFNSDNHLDIVVVDSETNNIVIFRGDGNGTVAVVTIYSTGLDSMPSSIAVEDLNKDNRPDIVVANFNSNEVLVFLATSNGTFRILNSYSLEYNARPQSVAIGDMNNDDLLDIIVAKYGTDSIEVLLQTC